MASPASTYQIPLPAPSPDPAPAGPDHLSAAGLAEASERAPLCVHCGAVGTHFLTCASLRLPVGYRVAADPAAPGSGLTSGPRHPDWPLPPLPAQPAPGPLAPPPGPAPVPPGVP